MTGKKQLTVHHMDLFPTRVWTVELGVLDEHIPGWVAAIEKMRVQNPKPVGRSNRMGWNSDPTLLDDARFAPLAQAAHSLFSFVFDEMGPPKHRFVLKAWANVHDRNGYNVFHNHPNTLLSACYYLQVPEGSGSLVLRDPRPGALLSPWQGTPRPNSGSEFSIAPHAGQLVIFPNWLEHATETHEDEKPRISIPINALAAL